MLTISVLMALTYFLICLLCRISLSTAQNGRLENEVILLMGLATFVMPHEKYELLMEKSL